MYSSRTLRAWCISHKADTHLIKFKYLLYKSAVVRTESRGNYKNREGMNGVSHSVIQHSKLRQSMAADYQGTQDCQLFLERGSIYLRPWRGSSRLNWQLDLWQFPSEVYHTLPGTPKRHVREPLQGPKSFRVRSNDDNEEEFRFHTKQFR